MRISILTIFVICITFCTAFSQWGDRIKLSKKITMEEKNISGFNKIDAEEDFEVIVRFSDQKESVKIEANENLHPYIIVEKVGKTLKLRLKNYHTFSFNNGSARERLVVYVRASEIIAFKGNEDVTFELDNKLITDEISITLDEDSHLSGELVVKSLVADLDGDSVLDLDGSADHFELIAREDSQMKNYNFTTNDLDVKLTGDSEARLTVIGQIDLTAKGDSNFYYKGKGTFIRQYLTGDSEVKSWD